MPKSPKKNGRIDVFHTLLPGTKTRIADSTASATNSIDFTRGLSPVGAAAARLGADFDVLVPAGAFFFFVFFLVVCFFADNPFTFLFILAYLF
jgi:hypothetical protein